MVIFYFLKKKKMQVLLSAFDSDASLDVLDHPILNLIYYMVSLYIETIFFFTNIWTLLSAPFSSMTLEMKHVANLVQIYPQLVEILPSAFVLFILRKLPPKRVSAQYHPIR